MTQWRYQARLGAQGLGMPPGARTRLRAQLQASLLVPDLGILNRSQTPLLSLEVVEALAVRR
jgi:hypothetical protein